MSKRNLSKAQFEVRTVHDTPRGPQMRRQNFEHYEDAEAAMKAANPDSDGSLIPNAERFTKEPRHEKTYSQGGFVNGSKFAEIHNLTGGPIQYREA